MSSPKEYSVTQTLRASAWVIMLFGLTASSLAAPHPIVLLPYPLFFFVFRLAKTTGDWWTSLLVTVVCIGWNVRECIDARYIRVSTLNVEPLLVAVVQTVLVGALLGQLWLAGKRRERNLPPKTAPGLE